MQSPLSINCKPWYTKDWQGCLAFLRVLNPTTAVMAVDQIDHINRILETQDAIPTTKVVARFIDEIHDGSMHLKPQTNNDKYIVSPTNQLNRIRDYGRNGLTAYFGNEPDTKASPDDLKRLADHTIEAMDLAARRDYDMSLTILNLGIGHPKPVDGMLPSWMNPVLLKLNDHHDRHYYGLHSYLPMDILEHLKALKKTCVFLKIPMPRCIITEWGFDNDGTNSLNGFKNRGITAENFAEWCVDACQDEFRPWLESGDLLGICTFIYGDDASWKNYNVETGMNGEVSTGWRDEILKAKREGRLDIKPVDKPVAVIVSPIPTKDLVYGEPYRISTPGKIINAYAEKSISMPLLGFIPDQAVVEVGKTEMVDYESWLQVRYPTAFSGWGWIKIDLVGLRQTVTVPIVRSDTVVEVPKIAPQSPPALETVPVGSGLPEIPETGLKTSQNAFSENRAAILTQLKIVAGAINTLITLLENEPIKV